MSTRFGDYLLLERLGQGGMAEVWRARRVGSERDVVIKRMLPGHHADPAFSAMFAREARLSARLRHPHIVEVFDFGEVDGEPFIAMEYVDGVDLARLMTTLARTGARLPVGVAAMIAHDLAEALEHAHAATDEAGRPLELVHRDVSPSNVLLGRDGSVKLVDFGIARAAGESRLTATGTFKGKVGYASPEVVEGGAHDARSDLFALGVVLHEMLAGRRLFSGASDIQTLGLVRAAQVPPASELNREVPPSLDDVCFRALARLPADRFESSGELARALAPLVEQLQGTPDALSSFLAAHPPAPAAQVVTAVAETNTLARPRRRLPTLALALGALVVGLTGWWLTRPAPLVREPAPLPVAPPVVAAPSSPVLPVAAPPPPPPPSRQRVVLESTPPGATVKTALGEVLGKTPFEQSWDEGARPRALTLELAGFARTDVPLDDVADQRKTVTLRALKTKASPTKKSPSRRDKRKPTLKDGAVVDPFR
ncbi:MAG: serine/threonine-protein kinase [Myxococcota bacterium]